MKKSKDDLARGWVLKAESDLADVRRTLKSDGPYDTACFHCQQAAEKYLKAFLAWHEKEIPRTHDIEELFLLCQPLDSSLKSLDVKPEELTDYAVEMRYDAEFWPDKETAEKALDQVTKIREAIIRLLPLKIDKQTKESKS